MMPDAPHLRLGYRTWSVQRRLEVRLAHGPTPVATIVPVFDGLAQRSSELAFYPTFVASVLFIMLL